MFRNSVKLVLAAVLCMASAYVHAVPVNISDGGVIGDERTSIVYDVLLGEISVDTPASTDLTTVEIKSVAGIFTGPGPAQNLTGIFDVWFPDKIFKLDPAGFSSLSFGLLAQPGLAKALLLGDLVVDGSKVGGGDLGPVVDLVYLGDDPGGDGQDVPLQSTLVW